jgi:hypothetical protein
VAVAGLPMHGECVPVATARGLEVATASRRDRKPRRRVRHAPLIAESLEDVDRLGVEAIRFNVIADARREVGQIDLGERRATMVAAVTCDLDALGVERTGALEIALLRGDTGEIAAGRGDGEWTIELAVQEEAGLVEGGRRGVIAAVRGEHAGSGQGARSPRRDLAAEARQGALEPGASLGQVASDLPESPEARCQAELQVSPVRILVRPA